MDEFGKNRGGSLLLFYLVGRSHAYFVAGIDKRPENAIKVAKSTFAILQSYEFKSSISMEGTKKFYSLQWRSKDTADNAYINIRVEENGVVTSYSLQG